MKIKGGNTNLYSTKIIPRKRREVRIIKKRKNTRGGGIFSFLAKGLSTISKKIPSTLANISKKKIKDAIRTGSHIAKRELQKPEVQKAIKSAIADGSKLVASHIIQKVSGNATPSLRGKIINHVITGEGNTSTKRAKNVRRLKRRDKRRLLFQTK